MDQSVAVAEERRARRGLLTALVWIGAVAALVFAFRDLKWAEFVEQLKGIEWLWVLPAVFFDVLSYVVQAWRWNYVLKPLGAPSLLRSTQAIYVGLFTNEVLPLRPGEVVRAYLVSQWNGQPFSVVLSSVGIERLLDGFWLSLGFGVTALFVPLPAIIRDGAKILAVAVVAGVALTFLVLALGLRVTHALERTRAGKRRIASAVLHFIDRLFEGLQAIGHSASLYWALATSLLLLFTQVLALWAMMLAYKLDFELDSPFWVASALLFMLHLGTIIPNAPANIGWVQFFCVQGLMLFDVDKGRAASFALVMFIILTVPLLIGGTLAVMFSGLSIGDIRHHVRRRAGFGR